MIIENTVGCLSKKIARDIEPKVHSAEGVSLAVESEPDEERFSKLLEKAAFDDEHPSAVEIAMPSTTPEAPPVPVHVFNFELLVRDRKANLNAEGKVQGHENKLALNSVELAPDNGGVPALLVEQLSGKIEQQGVTQKTDDKKNKFTELEFNLLDVAFQLSPDLVTIKSTVSMGSVDDPDRASKVLEVAPTSKRAEPIFQILESVSDAPVASAHGSEIGMSTGAEAFPQVETPSFWTANGIQNLAMTLDGQGDAPIEVKISLSGLDARVDIRTDHAALRQMIEGSVQDIKDQLRGEGLSLSAVSVGAGFQGRNSEQTPDQKNKSVPDSAYFKGQTLDRLSLVHLPASQTGRKLSVFV